MAHPSYKYEDISDRVEELEYLAPSSKTNPCALREKLLNRLRILCEKLDAEKLPTDIEEAQEILKK